MVFAPSDVFLRHFPSPQCIHTLYRIHIHTKSFCNMNPFKYELTCDNKKCNGTPLFSTRSDVKCCIKSWSRWHLTTVGLRNSMNTYSCRTTTGSRFKSQDKGQMCFHSTSCVVFCTARAVTNHLLSDADYCLTYDSNMGTRTPATRRVSSGTGTNKYAKLKVHLAE